MRTVGYILAMATMAGVLAACAGARDPQANASPGASPSRDDSYSTTAWDYYNYRGVHPGPERTFR